MNQSPIPKKLFISHSSQDLSYVSHLVRLLQSIGMDNETMFCSSVKGFGTPLGSNIYDYLRMQFQNYDLKVIFILSRNYYKSAASLNEMGAAWALQHSYTSILLPKFEFKDIKGAIDPRNISIKLDSSEWELKERLNELKDDLQAEFFLKPLPQIIWEGCRDDFIKKTQETASLWEQLHWLDEQKRPASEWLFPLMKLESIDPNSFDVLYMSGLQYLQLRDLAKANEYFDRALKVATDEDMRNSVKRMKQNMRQN